MNNLIAETKPTAKNMMAFNLLTSLQRLSQALTQQNKAVVTGPALVTLLEAINFDLIEIIVAE